MREIAETKQKGKQKKSAGKAAKTVYTRRKVKSDLDNILHCIFEYMKHGKLQSNY